MCTSTSSVATSRPAREISSVSTCSRPSVSSIMKNCVPSVAAPPPPPSWLVVESPITPSASPSAEPQFCGAQKISMECPL